MADHGERPDDDWANWVAKRTFLATVVLVVLYLGTVLFYVMR